MRLTEDQIDSLSDQILQKLLVANREGTIDELLTRMGWQDMIIKEDFGFYSLPTGKIVVLGASEVKEKNLRGVCKELGFDKNRLEFHMDYSDFSNFNFRKYQWQSQYRVILMGPMPHKTSGTGKYNSAISALKSEPGYPKVIELQAGTEIKITKQNFSQTLQQLINEGYIAT